MIMDTAELRSRPIRPAIENPESFRDLDYEQWDSTRAAPVEDWSDVDTDGHRWAAQIGVRNAREIQGATFLRLAEDVFVIPVRGAQPLHHDRHLAEIPDDSAKGFSEHTWNMVVQAPEGIDAPSLMLEVAQEEFQHFPLTPGAFIYMNTVNRHAVAPRNKTDLAIIVQVDGYGPDERDEAEKRIMEVISLRPVYSRV